MKLNVTKSIGAWILAVSIATAVNRADAALVVGDIGVVGFNVDGLDDFALVALTDITNEIVFITDSAPGTSTEGVLQWDTGLATIPAGTVIVFNDASDGGTSSIGTLFEIDNGFNLAQGGDAFYVYSASDFTMPDTYLTAASSDDFGQTSTGDLAATGLVKGVSAIEFGTASEDGGIYIGPRSGLTSFSEYFPLINDPMNWDTTTATGDGEVFFDANIATITTSFTVAAVPEPGSFAVLGFAGCCMLTRRKKRRVFA
tara:strand:+ start:95679 stop:96449 length:771 start_codon:yes stop_codon:yes gene_type:complete